jgi:fumarylacetoacetase
VTGTWVPVPEGSGYGLDHLPYGVFAPPGTLPRVGVRIGDHVLDLAAALGDFEFTQPGLNAFMARGPEAWDDARRRVVEALTAVPERQEAIEPALYPLAGVELRLPFAVADYVDFYASEYHAANVGRIFRPGTAPLPTNWKHLPNAYHGRSGTVVVSGTPVVRPRGQRKPTSREEPRFGPTARLDFEAEVGFVVGTPSPLGARVPVEGGAAPGVGGGGGSGGAAGGRRGGGHRGRAGAAGGRGPRRGGGAPGGAAKSGFAGG